MAQQIFSTPNLIYWTAIALIIYAQASTFGKIWKRKENHRWTMGWFTVFFVAIPFVWLGHFDALTWLVLFFAVGVSGAVKVGLEQYNASLLAETLRQAKPKPEPETLISQTRSRHHGQTNR